MATANNLEEQPEASNQDPSVITLNDFLTEYGGSLMDAIQAQNPPIFSGIPAESRELLMDRCLREPFDAQRDAIQAAAHLLIDEKARTCVINGEMGCGKTLMGILTAAILDAEGFKRTLVISPPHLVYKFAREIKITLPKAKTWVLNGPDTLAKLLTIREQLQSPDPDVPEFFIIGRVRMRMGFHWEKKVMARNRHQKIPTDKTDPNSRSVYQTRIVAACPNCGQVIYDDDGNEIPYQSYSPVSQENCPQCQAPLWSLVRPTHQKKLSMDALISKAMQKLPTIGPKTAQRLIDAFGAELLSSMLTDNLYGFVNLLDNQGELVFSDNQARRIERTLAKIEISFGQGGFQPSEFVKRYIPKGYFSNLIVDEAHEDKAISSAQGLAMGVMASQVKKIILLTGTLMGGYADDLFYLLHRTMPTIMSKDGYRYNTRGSLRSASLSFMRDHGVLKDIYKESPIESHKTAKGKRVSVHTTKGPGFGPKGIARYILPYTVFVKLRDLGENALPPYHEHFIDVPMTNDQASHYNRLSYQLEEKLKKALAKGDKSLLGVVLNALLRWPDTCFRPETVKHPRNRTLLAFVPSLFENDQYSPKEWEMVKQVREAKKRGQRTLIYTTYTGKQDTADRLKNLLKSAGFKASVLRSSVDTMKREDWIFDQVDRGLDALICNPELVKTGLDLLDFPNIVYMQTGYNVYTLMQSSRRSWRIGQRCDVNVTFLGYSETAQINCLSLMAKKIAVCQSTSGDLPETGLDILNQDGDSIEVELAKQLVA